ncbi:MAG: ring-cleaving dioxygenase [Bryobacteraceae bacterium]|jgi:glyoxalase family protein
MKQILGIHHITAIAGDPRQNLDFYGDLLGLRLVKRTVNFDDPATYHFYFGDREAHPGTFLTFFPWPGAPRGRHGAGQATAVSFSIPEGAMGYWMERLKAAKLAIHGPQKRFGEETISFHDHDGLPLELVANPDVRPGSAEGPVPAEHAIRGIHGVTLSVEVLEKTATVLSGVLSFRPTKECANRFRYEAGSGGAGAVADVEWVPGLTHGEVAVGTVHHVAWRTPNEAEQREWRREIAARRLRVTPVVDRKYFRSIYFREPGGVLFEIATDGPGFAVDEPAEELGTRLVLPPWLEPRRRDLEVRLPPLDAPQFVRQA